MSVICFIVGVFTGIVLMACLYGGDVLLCIQRTERLERENKELKKFVEPLITKSKDDTTNSRRVVFSNLQSKEAVTELFKEISVKVAERPGGYTRIIKLGTRLGDAAQMCFIELVDYNENMAKAQAKKTRRRRSTKKADAPVVEETVATEEATPAVAE